jgi:hypothetical protein
MFLNTFKSPPGWRSGLGRSSVTLNTFKSCRQMRIFADTRLGGVTSLGEGAPRWGSFEAAGQVTIPGAGSPARPADIRSATVDGDAQVRARILGHWQASEQGDSAAEHAIYAADAILDYPQSGERFRGRATIAAQRGGHPASRHFTVLRITGTGDLWVSECVISYDGVPSHSVSIMEFSGGLVGHETQYFADPFDPAEWRAALAEQMPGGSG